MSCTLRVACAALLAAAAVGGLSGIPPAQETPPKPEGTAPAKSAPASAGKIDEQAEEAILKKLQQSSEFSFQETPLRDIVASLARKHALPIVLNEPALSDTSAGDLKLTIAAKGISLEQGLNRLLKQANVTWVVRHEALEITSQEDADTYLVNRVYPVGDLVMPAPPPGADAEAPAEPDYDSLMDLIRNVIRPDSWTDTGGPGSLEPAVRTLVVSQTQATHRQIAALLAALRASAKLADPKVAAASVADPKRSPRPRVFKCHDGRAEERVAETLGRSATIDLEKASLADLAKAWQAQFGLDVALDQRGLQEAGVDAAKTTFGLRSKERSLRSALEVLLREHKLSWIVEDGALVVTSRDKMATTLTVRVYPVADLVVAAAGTAETTPARPSPGDPFGTPSPVGAYDDPDALMQVIKNTLLPDSWVDAGGPGSLEFFEPAASLVCSQTREAHEKIEQLLAELRERGTPVRPKPQPNATTAADPRLRDDEIVLRAYVLSADVSVRAKVADEAAKLVRELVAPDSWTAKDSPAFLRVWPDRLVIRQTAKAHRELQKLLADLELLTPTGPAQPPAAPPSDD